MEQSLMGAQGERNPLLAGRIIDHLGAEGLQAALGAIDGVPPLQSRVAPHPLG